MSRTHTFTDPAALRELEDELLIRLASAGGASTIANLFGGTFRPMWALEAADRCEDKGLVRLRDDRATELTPEGEREARRAVREMVRRVDIGRNRTC
jgi:hypothetical protein